MKMVAYKSPHFAILLVSAVLQSTLAFVQPRTFINGNNPVAALPKKPTELHLLPNDLFGATSILLGDEAEAIAAANASLEGVRTFFAVVAAIVFGLVGFAYFTAAVIVPKAAAQLEQDTKRLRPGLWEEYEAKLEEGQTMATRPDLLQQLGDIMRPVIIQEYDDNAKAKESQNAGPENIASNDNGPSIVDSDKWKD
uniref:Uncharacterized protein n=1 Tax=Trieres chinensis TaxID=1514140 RepID=A0A7S1ZHW6_TRICV|mmetsp:Transcript_26078/g.53391  ORF Transcript_26078/g.53391 Transcript_26078/m.53391 type:complete len:196 (+) Transcript_26078:135-722(+)|eukprot:CAMPEP_0183320766 /NCGR_PEP_ID=MMETSP0160_2-20130417/67144_1 /TAXON_ID=2839 ORGANISM="Odontella Sinensis, Strain Grunow 1884" /NCGR_SAMPLE_ID=MMETSP0160_2 /ASSEMBLY_ACC=CAM_ASM_000250 /LENGTH=195 /DNA_ID=CAMNT_0025487529 /DNA_START=74 /DNA_END=661 /DNA_ORIENTATION=-